MSDKSPNESPDEFLDVLKESEEALAALPPELMSCFKSAETSPKEKKPRAKKEAGPKKSAGEKKLQATLNLLDEYLK